MSVGKRSGVNCILENTHPVILASVLIRRVFPIPGIPSTRVCPLLISASIRPLITSFCPMTVFPTSSLIS
jgi:hypothetical protein